VHPVQRGVKSLNLEVPLGTSCRKRRLLDFAGVRLLVFGEIRLGRRAVVAECARKRFLSSVRTEVLGQVRLVSRPKFAVVTSTRHAGRISEVVWFETGASRSMRDRRKDGQPPEGGTHVNGFSPECVRRCRVSADLSAARSEFEKMSGV
jgi:hypothetical protein